MSRIASSPPRAVTDPRIDHALATRAAEAVGDDGLGWLFVRWERPVLLVTGRPSGGSKVLLANPAAGRFFGLRASHLAGEPLDQVLSRSAAYEYELLRATSEAEGAFSLRGHVTVHGRTTPVRVESVTLPGADGAVCWLNVVDASGEEEDLRTLRAAILAAPVGMLAVAQSARDARLPWDGEVLLCNARAAELLDKPGPDAVDAATLRDAFAGLAASDHDRFLLDLHATGQSTCRLRGPSGPLDVRCLRQPSADGSTFLLSLRQVDVNRDASAREVAAALGPGTVLALRATNDALWEWNLQTDRVRVSARWWEMLGCDSDEDSLAADAWLQRVHPDDAHRLRAEIDAHVSGRTARIECEHRLRHEDGHWLWAELRGVLQADELGQPIRVAGAQTDISRRKKAEEELLYGAFHDSLTHLPNRSLFHERLQRASVRNRRQQKPFAVVMLDVDGFKRINDTVGQIVGDQLLVGLAERIRPCLRMEDTLARFDGDTFAILLEDLRDASDATRVAQRIREELRTPFRYGGQEIFLSVSVGVALSFARYETTDEVLRDAETAMFRARALGGGRHEQFDVEMHAEAVNRLRLETDLRLALERDELYLHYQPLIDLETGCIAGFEALARWHHADRGMVSPGEFIPVAEQTGLIVPLGRRALEQACEQVRRWRDQIPDQGDIAVSVNLSVRQLIDGGIVEDVERILADTGVPARCLKLEITESSIMEDVKVASEMLERLRLLDLAVQLDDFGTGYSSLAYLHRFTFDALKIDRSFTEKLVADCNDDVIARTIVALGQSLGIRLIAEGVETAAQLAELRKLSCEFGQGYFFSRPVEAAKATELLASKPTW